MTIVSMFSNKEYADFIRIIVDRKDKNDSKLKKGPLNIKMKFKSYKELEKLITKDSGYKEYIEFLKYYFNYAYKYFTNKEKADFYYELASSIPWDASENEFPTDLMFIIDDIYEEMEDGDILYTKGYIEKYDEMFIKIFKKYNML